MHRKPMNKARAARQFNQAAARTKQINIAPKPTRGGGRL